MLFFLTLLIGCALFWTLLIGCALFVDFANTISFFENWQCMDCLRGHLLYSRHFLQIEIKPCMWMHPHPMYDPSNMEFPEVLFFDHYSFPVTSVTSLYSSKHVANFSQMTQQSTAVTLISESYRSHYRTVSTVCENRQSLIICLLILIKSNLCL